MESNQKIYLSWTVVILTIIFCWPIGLLYLKFKDTSKNKLIFAGKTKIVIGIFSVFFGLVGLTTEMEDTSDDLLIGIILITFFLSLGIYLIYIGIKNIKEGKIYDQLVYLIKYEKIENMQDIAERLKINLNDTNKYMVKAISMKYIDEEIECKNGKIIYKRQVVEKEEKKKKEHIVKCNSCGGINTVIEGENSICEYCGMQLFIRK